MYSFGAEVLAEELKSEGFNVLSSQDHNEKYGLDYHHLAEVPLDEEIDLVVFGYDSYINFYKMTFASYCIQNGVSI